MIISASYSGDWTILGDFDFSLDYLILDSDNKAKQSELKQTR